jgi:AraC-like DNA-binding protein
MSGKKFTQFVNEIRIVHACKLLTESQDSISNISYASGFNNFSHFNRQFKNITGESPSAYRKKITQVLHEV